MFNFLFNFFKTGGLLILANFFIPIALRLLYNYIGLDPLVNVLDFEGLSFFFHLLFLDV